jgi:hypothetical protein
VSHALLTPDPAGGSLASAVADRRARRRKSAKAAGGDRGAGLATSTRVSWSRPRTTFLALLAALAVLGATVPASAGGGHGHGAAAAPARRVESRYRFSREPARPLDRAARRQLTATLREVNDLVRSLGGVPPAVTLHASGDIDMTTTGDAWHRSQDAEQPMHEGVPRANPMGVPRSLRTGQRLRGDAGDVTGRGARAITVHEYAHLVFTQVMVARSPRLASLVAARRRHEQLVRRASRAASPREADAAEGALARLEASPRWAESEALLDILPAYDELFADTVAVLHDGAPDAVSGAFGRLYGNDYAERDFGRRNTNRSTRAAVTAYGDLEHDISAPLRSLLWRTYQRRLAAGERDPRPPLLRALARASVEAVEARLETGRPLRSVAAFNRDLRRRLQADPDFAAAVP